KTRVVKCPSLCHAYSTAGAVFAALIVPDSQIVGSGHRCPQPAVEFYSAKGARLAHKLARSRRAFEDESRERLDLAFKRFLACVSTQIGRRQRKPAGERLDYLQRIVAYLHEVEHARAHKRIRLVIAMAPEQGPDRVDPCLILLPHDSADFRRNA